MYQNKSIVRRFSNFVTLFSGSKTLRAALLALLLSSAAAPGAQAQACTGNETAQRSGEQCRQVLFENAGYLLLEAVDPSLRTDLRLDISSCTDGSYQTIARQASRQLLEVPGPGALWVCLSSQDPVSEMMLPETEAVLYTSFTAHLRRKSEPTEEEIEPDQPVQEASLTLDSLCRELRRDDHPDAAWCVDSPMAETVNAHIDARDDLDVFAFSVKSLSSVRIAAQGSVSGALFNSSGDRLRSSRRTPGGFEITKVLVPGDYFLHVAGAMGAYRLELHSVP